MPEKKSEILRVKFRRGIAGMAIAAGLGIGGATISTQPAFADAGFKKWINGFYSVARKSGVSRATYNKVFKGINSPDEEVLQLTRYQPEFVQEVWQYFDSRVNQHSIETGKLKKAEWANWLARIEKKYGVDRNVLLAIWSMETSYGEALEKPKAMRSVARSLATLSYLDRRRRKYARTQLVHALKAVQRGDITPANLTGSWAGAMGHTQFIPSSYTAYGVDADGDGRRDIWNSIPDALATAANLLRKNGWQTGQTWGYEVIVPRSVGRGHENKSRTLAQWAKLGIRRTQGRAFTRPGTKAVLKRFAGNKGPAFLMTKNFFVLKRYNNADKYALAVGHLADQIAGHGSFSKDWERGFEPLTFEQNMKLQQVLLQKGLYDGEIDGKIGSGSRAAIRVLQEQLGMKPTGYASQKLWTKLKRG